MWRSIHSVIGMFSAILLIVTAFSGGILSTKVVIDGFSPFIQDVDEMSLAQGLKTLIENYQEVEKLEQKPNGSFMLTHRIGAKAFKIFVNLKTGERLDKQRQSEFYAWMRGLHRSFFLERFGRAIVGVLALIMSALCLSGTFLIIRRQGGLQAFFSKAKGHWSEKIHTIFARLCLIPLIIIGVTGVYMSLVTFHFIPSGEGPNFPETIEELDPVAAYELKALKEIKLKDLQEITFPIPGDWFDVYTVKLGSHYVFVDQFTGEVVTKPDFGLKQKIFDWIMFLHTAEGSVLWAVILGVVSLSVPLFAITGTVVWYRRKVKGAIKIKHNVAAHNAEMVILVGSESGSTWGFAKNLHENLTKSGIKTHINQMNKIRQYSNAKHLFIFTSTYGDGDAPQNANKFKRRMTRLLSESKFADSQNWSHSILAFGDKAFPKYCVFAHQVEEVLAQLGKSKLIETVEVNRKSSQTYAHWGRLVVSSLAPDYDIQGEFDYSPPRPKTQQLVLRSKQLYGVAVNAPTSVFKFSNSKNKIGKHLAGDLVGIVPPNDNIARLYSIGSNSTDGQLEICVKQLAGGVCSTFLHDMQVGETIDMYLIKNEDFHIPRNKKPVMLIGAGTGIAPFVGMINQNIEQYPISLYWGGRDPSSDFLYEDEIKQWLSDGKLTDFYSAFSRVDEQAYVQDRVAENRKTIAKNMKIGGTIMVCGGAAMAQAVREILSAEFASIGLDYIQLKKIGRYKEDIY